MGEQSVNWAEIRATWASRGPNPKLQDGDSGALGAWKDALNYLYGFLDKHYVADDVYSAKIDDLIDDDPGEEAVVALAQPLYDALVSGTALPAMIEGVREAFRSYLLDEDDCPNTIMVSELANYPEDDGEDEDYEEHRQDCIDLVLDAWKALCAPLQGESNA